MWSALLASVLACEGLDRVPIIAVSKCAPDREVVVACVLDGDTFEAEECGGEAVRLLGINAPEIAHNDAETDECYGPEAAEWLGERILGRKVRLAFEAVEADLAECADGTECCDVYGRTLAYAFLVDDDDSQEQDQELVNETILFAGRARVYEEFDDILLRDVLYSAQSYAQDAHVGLWAECE